ncbi:hypothetical protein [Sinorhizobium meliloti]|uniref:hypothetical protein n=1 Tax=Rhizobium meliloti TaxID=382 RepID=UPI0002861958|nr:hypothetical protein [Sinorhizobium meliloti]ASP83075.1 hypothetical protein CDO27_35335 [Sinorhizobium meliloti]MQW20049.1 hypothetical protein [Sinorhizobium meliloti]CCM69594.1 hypothetical protein BN406_06657 [Sinorhizobium meliloti Rm41]
MSSSVGKDLKQCVGDQLRGVRYLVRMLGSDAQRNLAPPALPDVLPEFDRLLGKTFRAVDSVMSAVVTTVRPSTGAFRGFLPLEDYTAQQADALQEDIYKGLKVIAAIARSNQLILKSRVKDVQADMVGRRAMSEPREEQCSEFLVALVRRNPLVDVREDAGTPLILKQYIALALLLGLANSGRLPEGEALSLVEDALLLASTRLDTIAGHLKAEKSREPLAATLAVLLGHLAEGRSEQLTCKRDICTNEASSGGSDSDPRSA